MLSSWASLLTAGEVSTLPFSWLLEFPLVEFDAQVVLNEPFEESTPGEIDVELTASDDSSKRGESDPCTAISARTSPTGTVSPSACFKALITPEKGLVISMVALSD
jgi:hypothetical protein